LTHAADVALAVEYVEIFVLPGAASAGEVRGQREDRSRH
jgi:hypothetical protein